MTSHPETADFELIYVIVASGQGSRVLHLAKDSGISGATVILGSGTSSSRVLRALALCELRKEIVLAMAEKASGACFLEALNKTLKLSKPQHGIAFSVPIAGICGSRGCACAGHEKERMENAMYQSVTVIVEKGKGEAVVEAAIKAGSKGATIINARGSGIHETARLFNLNIEPEKEIVLMIAKREIVEKIIRSIREDFQIDKPGNGIIFIQDVRQAYGLYE